MSKNTVFKPTQPYSTKNLTVLPKIDFFSGMINYGNRVFGSVQTSGASYVLIYQVPKGKSFFLVAASMSILATSVGNNTATLEDGQGNIFCQINAGNAAAATTNSANQSLAFSIPLKFNADEKIKFRTTLAGAGTDGSATLAGYEIDSSLLPNFF